MFYCNSVPIALPEVCALYVFLVTVIIIRNVIFYIIITANRAVVMIHAVIVL